MQCQKCENTAVYTRKYSGESLCSECFSNSILRKAAKTISKYKMIKNDELVVVGVSGGKDSLVLLSILKKMSETHNFRIIAVTIDEGIPGYRDEALEIVKSFCSKLDVEFRTYSYKELYDVTLSESLELRDEEKTTSCSICGIFRVFKCCEYLTGPEQLRALRGDVGIGHVRYPTAARRRAPRRSPST